MPASWWLGKITFFSVSFFKFSDVSESSQAHIWGSWRYDSVISHGGIEIRPSLPHERDRGGHKIGAHLWGSSKTSTTSFFHRLLSHNLSLFVSLCVFFHVCKCFLFSQSLLGRLFGWLSWGRSKYKGFWCTLCSCKSHYKAAGLIAIKLKWQFVWLW